jgi:hypothetical protein
MKESRFIELLNLYIDQQISPDDAALLEEAILQNPRRRQVYLQYCRMHRACTIVLDRSQSENEVEATAGRVVAFAAPRRSHRGYYAAGLAAAACVTLVAVLSVLRSDGNAPTRAVATAPSSPAALAKSTPATAITPVHMDTPAAHFMPKTEGYIAQHLRFTQPVTGMSGHFFLAASDSDNIRFSLPTPSAPALRAPPRPSIEDFVFTQDPATPENPKIFRSHQPGDESDENAAIEFQR